MKSLNLSTCNGLFLLPERKSNCKKIDIVSGFWGVFPLKESMWKSQYALIVALLLAL